MNKKELKKWILSPVMLAVLAELRKEPMYRSPGGFWGHKGWSIKGGRSYGSNTIQALVTRERAVYTEWQQGKNGKFPITVEAKEMVPLAPGASAPR